MRGRPSVKGAAKISAGARRRPLFGLFRWPLHAGAARERLSYVSRPNSSVCGRFRRAARCVSTRAKPRSSGRDFGQGRVALRHLSVVAAAQGCMTMMKVSTVLPCAPHRLAASEHGMVSRHRQRWSLPAVSTACPPRRTIPGPAWTYLLGAGSASQPGWQGRGRRARSGSGGVTEWELKQN